MKTFLEFAFPDTNYEEEFAKLLENRTEMVYSYGDMWENVMLNEVSEGLSDEQKTKREEIIKAMKKNKLDMIKRYGDKWEQVMYATATKKAKET